MKKTNVHGAKIIDMQAFLIQRRAKEKKQQAIDAANFLMLPDAGKYSVYKTDALEKLLNHAASVVFFSPEENVRSTTTIEKLLKACMLFKYDLYIVGDRVLQFVIVDRLHANIDVYLDQPIAGPSEILVLVNDLVFENRMRGSYVSVDLLNAVSPLNR